MADIMEIIIRAIDEASDIFSSIVDSAESMSDGIIDSIGMSTSEFEEMEANVSSFQDSVDSIDDSTIMELADDLGMSTEEVERLIEAGANLGSIPFDEAAAGAEEFEKEVDEATESMEKFGSAGDVMGTETLMKISEGLSSSMMNAANTAGYFEDSMTRVGLAAEGIGVPVDTMKQSISSLTEETGRAGSSVRESFIQMSSAGITNVATMESVFKGASAQAFILGTDVDTLANKYAGMAMKSSVAERTLKGTGITVEELGEALGIQGATIDEVNAKWEEMDTDARAAALGQAAAMNEGANANDEFKNSWEGLQTQVEIAKGRLERLVGSVILPTLVPALDIASGALQGLGDIISFVMSSPLGGLVSILGTLGGAFIIAVTGVSALKNILGFLKVEASLAAIETTALAFAEEFQATGSITSAAANAIGATGFGGLATAATGAAAAVWAALAPLLPFIAAVAIVAVGVYELGKAFGWWDNVGSMLDAISAGLQRLWSAFINHPDVQAMITAISDAWNVLTGAIGEVMGAIGEFFGVTTGGEFDIVRAIIDGIGVAFSIIRTPIMAVINIVQSLISIFNQVATGQMSIQQAVLAVWNTLVANLGPIFANIGSAILTFGSTIARYALNAGKRFVQNIINFVRTLPGKVLAYLVNTASNILRQGNNWVNTARNKASQLVNGVINYVTGLPGRVYSKMAEVGHRIATAGSQWVTNARNKASQVVNGISSSLSGAPTAVYNKLIGIRDKIGSALSAAYNKAKEWVDKIKSKVSDISGGLLNFGGEAYGFELPEEGNTSIGNTKYTYEPIEENIHITQDINWNLDLRNVPTHISTTDLIEALTDKTVLQALTSNSDFQNYDTKYKNRINARANRMRGVGA